MSKKPDETPVNRRIYFLLLLIMIPVALAWIYLVLMGEKYIAIPLGLMAVSFFLVFYIAGKIEDLRNVKTGDSMKELDEAINGNLTVRMPIHEGDNSLEIKKRVNELLGNQLKTIRQFAGSSQLLSRTAFVLNDKSKDMAQEVKDAAVQVNMVASASEEMAATFTQIAGNCSSAVKSAEEANKAAQLGESTINDTVAAMNMVSEKVSDSAAIMESLGSRSEQIGEVISLINDIADQTNLLALNATIEAARAGEHGKGFAVVAEEVKELARRTTAATKDIDGSIKAMQEDAKKAVAAAEKGVKEVATGVQEAMKSGNAFKKVVDQITATSSQISQIAEASNQQTAVVGEITQNIQKISSVIDNAAKNVDENSQTASELAELFTGLNKAIEHYKIATLEDAEALAREAAAYIKKVGREKGIEELCNPKGRFMRDGIYVTGHDINGIYLANPTNPKLIGKKTGDKKGRSNKLDQRCVELAKGGGGWVEYEIANPATKVIQRKKARIENIPGTGMYVMCGIFTGASSKHTGGRDISEPVLIG